MVMYSNKLSAVQLRRNHSTFNAHSAKESVMSFTEIVRTNAVRMAWIMFTCVPSVMLANAAQADEQVASRVVSLRDLNMNSPEGVAVLYARIKKAANEVCGQWDYLNLSHGAQACINSAVYRAVAQVNSPMLTSLYNEKTGKANKKISLAQSR
jgi:UrcA family protein